MLCEKHVLKNFAKFTGKHMCQSLLFNKVAGLRPTTLLKKRLRHRLFPVNFAKFLKFNFFYRAPPVPASHSELKNSKIKNSKNLKAKLR